MYADLYRAARRERRAQEDPFEKGMRFITFMLAFTLIVSVVMFGVRAVIGWNAITDADRDTEVIRGIASEDALLLAPIYGERLTQLRQERKISEYRLATLLGADKFTLWEIQGGDRPMTRQQLQRAAVVLSVPVEHFTDLGGNLSLLPSEEEVNDALARAALRSRL